MIKAAVTAVWLLVAGAAAAQVDPVDESARKALAQGEYARVVDLYAPLLASGRTLADMSHYRLAIAMQKQGDAPAAWKHLRLALDANPQGSFASSPGRLADLRSSIVASCEKLGRPGCEEPAAPPALADTDPSATAAKAAASASMPSAAPQAPREGTTATIAPASALNALGAPAAIVPHETVQANGLAQWAWHLATLLVAVATLLTSGWIAWRNYRRDRRIPEGLDSVEGLRDNVAAFLAGLHATQRGRDSALYLPLANLLPLLEREAGRTLYRATGSTKALTAADLKAVEMNNQLSLRPLDVFTASPQEIEAHFRNVPV